MAADDYTIMDLQMASIDTHTLNPSAARLAANETEFIGNIHDTDDHLKQDELSQWIGGILGESLNPEMLFDELSNGVRLLNLAKSIQLIKCDHQKDDEYNTTIKNLQPDEYSVTHHGPPKLASLIAKQRSNIAKFLEWCTNIGVPSITLFETEDLTFQKNLRQVTTCLFYVSRIASKFGIEPPSSVKEQLKLEEEKSLLRSSTEKSSSPTKTVPTRDRQSLISSKETVFERRDGDHTQITSHSSKPRNEIRETDAYNHYFTSPTLMGVPADEPVVLLPPIDLKFEDSDEEELITDTHPPQDNFDSQNFQQLPDTEDEKVQDIPASEDFLFQPLEKPAEIDTVALSYDTKVRVPAVARHLNGNSVDALKRSSSSSSSLSSIKERQRAPDDDNNDFMYYTSFVDDDSDDEVPAQIGAGKSPSRKVTEPQDLPNPITEDIPDMHSMEPLSPFALHRIPADIVFERPSSSESTSDDSAASEVESYFSDDHSDEKTFADVSVGTEDILEEKKRILEKKKGKEIMIDFPPYFELVSQMDNFTTVPPPQDYIVAPAKNDQIYAIPNKSRSSKIETRGNNSDESEQLPAGYNMRDTVITPPGSSASSSVATFPFPVVRQRRGYAMKETGTQTHVTFSKDTVRILSDMNGLGTRTAPSSLSSGSTSRQGGGNTLIIRTQYQRMIPTGDKDVSITQVSDLQTSRPPRFGSVNSSTRHHRNRDPEIRPATPLSNPVRRSIIRRTSSMISEKFEKAVAIAKKYQKQIIILTILVILTIAALATMLAIFPTT